MALTPSPIETLPDSPGAVVLPASGSTSAATPTAIFDAPRSGGGLVARKYHNVIKANETAQSLTAGDKFLLALKSRVSAGAFAGALLSAGYTHLNNGRPHYGTDRGAFGERLGASELTGTSRAIFSTGVYASLFRQDPRYYVMGNRERFVHRTIYSASRVVLVGAPGEHPHVNISNLLGTASSAALANTYYPAQDRAFSKSTTSFITSLGTQAAGDLLDEFLGDILHKFHHKN